MLGYKTEYLLCADTGKFRSERCLSLKCPCRPVPLQDRPAMQLYQPGARNRKRMSSAGKGYDCIPVGHSPEPGADHSYEVVSLAPGLEKVFEKSKDVQ